MDSGGGRVEAERDPGGGGRRRADHRNAPASDSEARAGWGPAGAEIGAAGAVAGDGRGRLVTFWATCRGITVHSSTTDDCDAILFENNTSAAAGANAKHRLVWA